MLTNSGAATLTVDGRLDWAAGAIALPVMLSAGATLNLTGSGIATFTTLGSDFDTVLAGL